MPRFEFEKPAPRTPEEEEGIKGNKSEFREFLIQQISLPVEQWDERFIVYVEEKRKEQEKEKEKEAQAPEEESEQVFKRYLKNLDLKEENIKDKRILDIGSGWRGEFVRECIERGITQDIYGLDKRITPPEEMEEKYRPQEIEEKYRPHLIRGDYTEDFPIENLDYVIAHAVLLTPSEETEKTIKNALDALKKNGEMRFYPVAIGPAEKVLKEYGYNEEGWKKLLDGLSKERNISYEIKPIDIVIDEEKTEVWLHGMVVIKKQEKSQEK